MNPIETLFNPSMMHAASVHMPIVLAMLGVPLIIASALFYNNNTLRFITFLAFVILAGSAWFAEISGQRAMAEIPNTLPGTVWDLVENHESMAIWIKYLAGLTSLFLLLSLFRHTHLRKGMLLLAACGSVITVIIIIFTAHMGGTLVYEYGVGTALVKESTPTKTPIPLEQESEIEVEEEAEVELDVETEPESPVILEPEIETAPETPIVDTAPETIQELVEPVEPDEDETIREIIPDSDEENVLPEITIPEEGDISTSEVAIEAEDDALIPVRPLSADDAAQISYRQHVWPIIDHHCISCHDAEYKDGGYDMTTVESKKLAGNKAGPGVIPGDPDNSASIKYIRGILQPQMPRRQEPLNADELHILRLWIYAGAQDN